MNNVKQQVLYKAQSSLNDINKILKTLQDDLNCDQDKIQKGAVIMINAINKFFYDEKN